MGAVATVPMSLTMLAARKVGARGKDPARRITELLLLVGLRAWPRRRHRRAIWLASHFAFGAAAGALFGLAAHRLRARSARVVAGALFGTAVWAGMYGRVLPALRLMPRLARDRPGRPTAMAISHIVYGASLGAWGGGG
jgi:hypothetical protein